MHDLQARANIIVSSQTRWLAIATGCLTTIAGLAALGAGFASVSVFLIVGAIVQPRFPRLGRGLMCAGAVWLSFWVFDVGVLMLFERHPPGFSAVRFAVLVSVLLVTWCDLAIVREELKIRRTGAANR